MRSPNPDDLPVVDPQFFTTEFDRAALNSSVRIMTKAMRDSKELGAVEFGIDEALDSDAAMEARFANGGVVYHPSGTCAMGSVVDTECRVSELRSLRVVDASIMPTPLSTHYQAPVYAIAEQVRLG